LRLFYGGWVDLGFLYNCIKGNAFVDKIMCEATFNPMDFCSNDECEPLFVPAMP